MTRTTTTRQTANGPTAPMRPHPMGPNVRAAPRTQPDERAVSLPKRVWDEVAPRRGPERLLWWVGGLLVLSGVVHTVVWLASGEPWAGSVSWRKPIVFGLSFGVTLVSQAWVMRHLPATRRLAWVLATGLAGSAALEVALITMQRWRGVPSHFNGLTPFDTVVFGMMAQSVFLFAGLTVVVLVWAAWRLPGGVVRIAAVGNRSRGAAAPPSALGAAHRRRLARTAGVLYLAVAVLGGWAHGYVRAAVYVPGNATTTAQNVVDQASLVRYGFVADLAQATLMLLVVLALYRLLQHVNRDHARAMVVFVVVSVAITCLNLVTQLGAVLVANEPAYASAFGPGGRDALVLLLLDLQHNGYLIAQIFFGLWLFPLGLLVYRSGLFPRLIGSALMIGAAAYVIDVPLQFLAPGIADAVSPIVLVPIVIVAEVSMLAYLLIRGVRESAHGPHIPFDPGRGTTEPTENAAAPEQPPHPTPVRP